jgi:hypothetical protein
MSEAASQAPAAEGPAAAVAREATAPSLPFWQRPEFTADLIARAKKQALPLAMILVFGSLDIQLHGQIPVTLLMVAGGAALAMFFREASNWVFTKLNLQPMATLFQPLLVSIPAALWFVIRGKGTVVEGQVFQGRQYSDAGITDANAMLLGILIAGAPLAFNYLVPRIDPAFKGFYELRDRYLSDTVRPFAMIVASLVVTFGIIHGNLMDMDILLGGQASKMGLPQFSKALIAAVINLLIGFLIMRKPQNDDLEEA